MARSYGGISVKIDGDYNNKDIKRAIADLKALDTDAKQAESKFAGMSKGMKMAGVAVAAAAAGMGVAVGKFAMDSISAASDLEESQSKVTTVFGDQANAVLKWAETSATAFGQSKQQALEAAGTYGNLFQAFGLTSSAAQEMSTTMVELAADLASFNNTSIDDAIQALRSGLSGETEPLKRFGVALTDARMRAEAMAQGIYEGNGALDAGQKAQAAYALIMKDTTLAQGDFSRTSDGLANTQRTLTAAVDNAKASIGVGLVNALQDLTEAVGGPGGAAKAIEDAGFRLGLFVEGLANSSEALGDVQVTSKDTRREIERLADIYRDAGGGIQGFIAIVANMDRDSTISPIEVIGQASRDAAAGVEAMGRVMAGSVKPADHLASSVNELRVRTNEATAAASAFVEQTGVQLFQIAAANRYYKDAAVRANRLAAEQEDAEEASTKAGSSFSRAGEKAKKMRIDFADAAKGFEDASVSIEGSAIKVSSAMGQAFEDRTEVFRNVINTQVSLIQQAQQELDRYAQSVTDAILGKIDFSTSDAEGNPLTPEQIAAAIIGDITNQTNAVRSIAESGVMTKLPEALAQKILSLPPDAAVALANYVAANPAQLEQLTTNYNALATYTETALGIPMATTFGKVGDTSAVEMIASARERIGKAAENFKNYVKRQLSTTITVSVRYEAVNSLPGVSSGSINVTARANGGPAFAGMPTLVGERGPELIIPSVDSTVVRGEKTRQMMRGTGSTINLTVNAGMGTNGAEVGREIVDAIKRYERLSGPVFASA